MTKLGAIVEKLRAFASKDAFPYIVIAVIGAVVATVATIHPLAATDTFNRYAPMARAFAEGDWYGAFHPRFGVGFQVLTGSLTWLTGLDGYRSCSLVSTVAWALSMVPLFRIADRLFGRTAAWFALVLFAICPQTLVWSFKGFRESFKMLGALLALDVMTGWRKGGWTLVAEAAAALASLILFKVDAVVIGGLFVCCVLAVDRFHPRSLVVAATGAILVQPMCCLVYSWTGWWLPAVQYISLAERVFGG